MCVRTLQRLHVHTPGASANPEVQRGLAGDRRRGLVSSGASRGEAKSCARKIRGPTGNLTRAQQGGEWAGRAAGWGGRARNPSPRFTSRLERLHQILNGNTSQTSVIWGVNPKPGSACPCQRHPVETNQILKKKKNRRVLDTAHISRERMQLGITVLVPLDILNHS